MNNRERSVYEARWRYAHLNKLRSPCPTCEGLNRDTVGMVCQTCGHDYAKGPKQ